jgi:hypothetical protein
MKELNTQWNDDKYVQWCHKQKLNEDIIKDLK